MPKKVLDISKWNIVNDFQKLAADVDGVIIRCGYRGKTDGSIKQDPKFKEYITNLYKLGVPVGIYFFTTAVTKIEAIEECDFAINMIEDLGVKLSFPIAIDSEYSCREHNGRSDALSKAVRTANVIAFCEQARKRGYESMIYASDSWFVDRLDINLVTNYKKWTASYSKKPTRGKSNMVGWQKTSAGSVAGIATRVDLSDWYTDINLNAALYNSTPSVPPTTPTTSEPNTVILKDTPVYVSSTAVTESYKRTGVYYIWSDKEYKGRIRITNKKENIGNPSRVTGWIDASILKKNTTPAVTKIIDGAKLTLNNVPLYSSSSATKESSTKSGTYYVWSAKAYKNRIRITTKKENVGNAAAITGWINVSDAK